MLKRACVLTFFCMCCLLVSAFAQQGPKVVILPFDIYAKGDLQYLEGEILDIINGQFKNTGAEIIIPEMDPSEDPAGDIGKVREIGRREDADFVIWGSSTWTEDQYSIDAKMIEMKRSGEPRSFFTEGKGLENLLSVVQKFARDLSMAILKQEKIIEIRIAGNDRIEKDAILRKIETQPGDPFIPKSLTKDLMNVYAMGYFDDIRIEAEDAQDGKIVIFTIKEKPTIRKIIISGNSNNIYKDEKIIENISIKTGSIFNIFKIKGEIKKIEGLYKEKNYQKAVVTYEIKPLENNQADLEFKIDEGEKSMIRKIIFEGNQAFTPKELKKIRTYKKGILGVFPFSLYRGKEEKLGKMETTKKGFFSFITSSGELNMEKLSQDVAKLTMFYHNHGYIDARIGEPEIIYEENDITIKIKIEEGLQYKTGSLDIQGDLILPREDLLAILKIGDEAVLNSSVLRSDIILLTDIYSDQGYFYAEIFPKLDKNQDTQVANLTFVINKGKPVYFEKIIITGNTKTRDKVIRRELPVTEQQLYSGTRLKRGIRNLYRLDYFEEVNVKTLKGSADDKMVLKLEVTEKPTGTFSFGGGYSNLEDLFASVSISKNNLFGRSQTLQLSAEWGGTTDQYRLSFMEPWLFDIPLSASFSVYNVYKNYSYIDQRKIGGSIGLGYPVYDYTRIYFSYGYDNTRYEDVEEWAPTWFLENGEDYEEVTSRFTTKLHYDSRDRMINATEGQDHSITITYAGDLLGGTNAFTKYMLEAGVYFPLVWNLVGFIHNQTGYVRENSNGTLPYDERFFLGGMDSLRGFDWRDVGPKTENENGYITNDGGNKFVQFNFEILFPLFKDAGLMGVVFYDTGNAYGENESFDLTELRESAGYGFRWYSPIGPIRIECGYILDPQEGEDDGGNWEFTMGGAF